MSDKFYNPYNFVPAVDPTPAGKYEVGADPTVKNPLGQGRPAGHDRYHEDLWSGRIGIEIEVVTPLMIPEAKPVREVTQGPSKGHKVFRTRRHGNSDIPLLPVTTLKGALRSAYEAVTNSRFGVFRGHDAPLARRMQAGEGLQLIPGRVVLNKKTDQLDVVLLMGTTSDFPQWHVPEQGSPRWQVPDRVTRRNGRRFSERQPQYAAWLPFRRTTGLALPADTENGSPVTLRLQKVNHNRPFAFWEVVSLSLGHSGPSSLPTMAVDSGKGYNPVHGQYFPSTTGAVHGYVLCNNHNIEGKHDERVFFSRGTPKKLPVSPDVVRAWKDLILDYKAVYKRDGWNHAGTVPSRL